ncbi:MAG: M2 family metallopeptidase [Planctomycetes bacterium]|nr:M2 family metallopeptidase [Planctomycetota bacterium]
MFKKAINMAAVICATNLGGLARAEDPKAEFQALHDAYLAKFQPLTVKSNQAWWDASISGKDEDFKKRKEAENALVELHSDAATFARIKALREGGKITDPLQRRMLDALYRNFLPYQADAELSKRIVALSADVDQIFNTHRSKVDGKELTENEVRDILADSKDTKLVEKAWKGYMEVGAKVEGKLKELVKLRNQVASKLGFKNYFALQMEIQELNEADLFKTFDELDAVTHKPFADLKKEIDAGMAARFGIPADQLRPWHTGDLFFQEAPKLAAVDLDEVFKSTDPVKLAADYYKGVGMPIEDVLARSDLYEKPGKSPHAFCTNINRADDVRVLGNVKPNARWMDTVLHELGHAVYDKLIAKDVPFVIHEPAHILTTEAVAMLFGSLSKNEEFLTKAVTLPPEQAAEFLAAARQSLRAEKLIFSRWTQVMLRFEHGMYGNPDQDLGKLWWDLKKRYQLLNPPEDTSRPDYGAKMHIVSTPVYYHNYMLGELMAAQMHHYLAKAIIKVDDPRKTAFLGSKPAGDYLRKEVFEPGNRQPWNDLIQKATGEPLTARHFAEIYVQ